MKPFNFILMTLPLFLLVSCTSESPQSIQEKQAELCTQLARFSTAVVTLKSMGPSSTVGDLRAAQDQVRTTFNDVKTTASTVKAAKAEELEQAYTQLDTTVRSIPETATLQQASESIATDVAAVEAAEAQMRSGLNCP